MQSSSFAEVATSPRANFCDICTSWRYPTHQTNLHPCKDFSSPRAWQCHYVSPFNIEHWKSSWLWISFHGKRSSWTVLGLEVTMIARYGKALRCIKMLKRVDTFWKLWFLHSNMLWPVPCRWLQSILKRLKQPTFIGECWWIGIPVAHVQCYTTLYVLLKNTQETNHIDRFCPILNWWHICYCIAMLCCNFRFFSQHAMNLLKSPQSVKW